MFDSDKLGKDKSLGSVQVNLADLASNEPTWIPLKGVKSGQVLLNCELLAPGQAPTGYVENVKGNQENGVKFSVNNYIISSSYAKSVWSVIFMITPNINKKVILFFSF